MQRARGVTLIDALVLIAVIGVLAAGNAWLLARLSAASAQAARDLQALQYAAGLMAEAVAMPMTFCDADDPQVGTAQLAALGSTGCAAQVDSPGPEPGETRFGPLRFDHVSDWAGYAMPGPGCPGLCDAGGALSAGGALAGCSAGVAVTPIAWGGIAATDAQGQPQALRVRVTLACPGAPDLVLEAIRIRDAPNRV